MRYVSRGSGDRAPNPHLQLLGTRPPEEKGVQHEVTAAAKAFSPLLLSSLARRELQLVHGQSVLGWATAACAPHVPCN
jgi:hypothetical protein